MSEPVKRYGIFKRLLDSESYCRRAVARGNQDKFRVNMVLATDYEALETRCAEQGRLISSQGIRSMADADEISEQAETITRLRRDGEAWTLRDILTVLVEAVEHLTIHHSCDCHGYEQYIAAKRAAWEIVAALSEGEK